MKFGKLYLLLVFFVLSSWNSVFAQSVTFSDLRLEHNAPDNSGRNMLQFHYSVTVTGCQGHDVRLYMWVDIPQGVTHYYADGNKMISQSNNLHCSWETTNFQNGWIGIYNDQLNPKPGKNTYYTRLGAWDETLGQYIGWSDFLSFENTGSIGPTATLKNCHVDHQKEQGMTFHLDFQVDNDKGKDVWCIVELAYYDYDRGTNTYYFNRTEGNYKYNNHLAVSSKHCAIYDNTLFTNIQMFLPYSEITAAIGNNLDWGRKILYCVKVVDADGRVLLEEWKKTPEMSYYQRGICGFCKGTSKCFMCKGTGWFMTGSCSQCFGRGRCTYCGGTGGHLNQLSYNVGDPETDPNYWQQINNQTIINQPMPDPVSRKMDCVDCKGSGKCTWCAGRGEYRNRYTGTMGDCEKCHGGGVCPTCHGHGYYYY
jgi:hypothetical protein